MLFPIAFSYNNINFAQAYRKKQNPPDCGGILLNEEYRLVEGVTYWALKQLLPAMKGEQFIV